MLGGLLAVALFGSFSFSEALILGVILAPTDAGLGGAVVTDPRLPQVVRQSLNVESGLNDGICVPLLLIVLATVSGTGGESHPLQVLAEAIGYGLLGGLAAGALAAAVVIIAGGRVCWGNLEPGAEEGGVRGSPALLTFTLLLTLTLLLPGWVLSCVAAS